MKKQNLEIEKAVLGFDVEFQNLVKEPHPQSELCTSELKLDVGCGFAPKGNVNTDLYIEGEEAKKHRDFSSELKFKDIPNFVLSDAHYLPFRDSAFDTVLCHQVIEHVPNPEVVLDELLRVAKLYVVVSCPHRLSRSKNKGHINFFKTTYFTKYGLKRKVRCFVEVTVWRNLPNDFFPLFRLPDGLTVHFYKGLKM